MNSVFLSSTARDLQVYRDKLTDVINRLDGFKCIRMEDFGARDQQADDYCRELIKQCDVAVFIVGLCYGSSPDQSEESYTVREYNEAVDAEVSRLVFLSEEGVFYSGYYRESDEQWQRQQAFRTRLSQELVRDIFATPDELASKLATALGNWAKGQAESTPANVQTYEANLTGSGSMAQGQDAMAVSGGIAVNGDVGGNIIQVGEGAKVIIGDSAPVKMTAVDIKTHLGRYLQHIIVGNRYLQLQGIRSGGKLVHIELDRIYIRLRATRQRQINVEDHWLDQEMRLAPGERHRLSARETVTTETVTAEEALASYQRLVVLGDPGCGKTTFLRYLALIYAKDMAEGDGLVRKALGIKEPERLPILLLLRQFGRFLQTQPDNGADGHGLLLDFLLKSCASDRIQLPEDFFDAYLREGRAVILLDGMDEVADPKSRQRVARLVESFTRTYDRCRYVVTSRIVGYTGTARLGEAYALTTVLDFTRQDIAQFLTVWNRLIAVAEKGDNASAIAYAESQSGQLLQAIDGNPRIRELAINPLLLTVIAMVHRDRVKLPDRRAELYAEAVDVLLGKWEEAKGVKETPILPYDQLFDTGDKRLLLQSLALHLHEQGSKEIQIADLRSLLQAEFEQLALDEHEARQAAERFLNVIEERTGLLSARGEGVYAFSHLTFQEFLAALAIAPREDYLPYTLGKVPEPWWREVILLEAGFLSTQSKEKTTALIQAIADRKQEPEPYHNLVLAAECLRDVGSKRVLGDLPKTVRLRLRKGIETPPSVLTRWVFSLGAKTWIERRAKAMEALVRFGEEVFWKPPYGEPEWVEIPAGEFWMGSERGHHSEKPIHKVVLVAYRISRVPITNAQYYLFTQATEHPVPNDWQDQRPPKGLESHPVVNVSWQDALDYCAWLGQVTGKPITFPSEAEWEKAARGDQDQREYPWGNRFEATRCNCEELGLRTTTPVGIFPEGASPYGCLDMAGNVWEWTRSLWADYPYPQPGDQRQQREDLQAWGERVLRGGSFPINQLNVRCSYRYYGDPVFRHFNYGFRIVVSPCL